MSVLIGITPDTHAGYKIKTRTSQERIVYLWDRYLAAIMDQGAVAVILPVTDDLRIIRKMLDRLNGIVLAGGNFDVPPQLYGQQPKPWLGPVKVERSRFELALLEQAAERDLPVLGICGGMQLINVAFGGTLHQDINTELPGSLEHQQKVRKDRASHQVTLSPGTRLQRIISGKLTNKPLRIWVNSTHHQAVSEIADGFSVCGQASDGIVEGLASDHHRFIVGVQWHPELLYTRQQKHARIFRIFVREAAKSR